MNNDKIWAFLIHLGSNMWAKKGTTWGRKIHPEDFSYKETMFCDKEVWRKVTDFLPSCGINTLLIDIGEGLLLDSHPEIAVPGAWTKSELKAEIRRLKEIGITCIPKYNFSCRHNAWMGEWAYRVGTPEFYDMCKDIIEEVIDVFDTPKFFHLGLEEEESTNEHEINVCRSPKRKYKDALMLFDVCRSKGVRPWIWLDEETFGGRENLSENLPKDVVVSVWYYGTVHNTGKEETANSMVRLIKVIDELGYDQIPTSSTWSWHCNSKDMMTYCKMYCNNGSIIGHMTASWMLTTECKLYALLNDAYTFGWARRDIYGDF